MEYGDDDKIIESENGRMTAVELYDSLGKLLVEHPNLKDATVWSDTPSLYAPINRITARMTKAKMDRAIPHGFIEFSDSEAGI